MYLKNDKIVATIGDLVIRSSSAKTVFSPSLPNTPAAIFTPTEEFILDPTAIIGWKDSTQARRDNASRLNSHGDFAEPITMSSRIVAMSGTAVATSSEHLQMMRDKLTGTLSDGRYAPLRIIQTGLGTQGQDSVISDREALVGLESTTSWVQQTDTTASWRITMFAPDPFLYSQERTEMIGADHGKGGLAYPLSYPLDYGLVGTNLGEAFRNEGNATAWPKFRVTGDYFTGFTITNGMNASIIYSGIVTLSAPVTIDMATGTATQSGNDQTVLVTKRDWFGIPPRSEIKPQFTPAAEGTGWCDIILRDTWI